MQLEFCPETYIDEMGVRNLFFKNRIGKYIIFTDVRHSSFTSKIPSDVKMVIIKDPRSGPIDHDPYTTVWYDFDLDWDGTDYEEGEENLLLMKNRGVCKFTWQGKSYSAKNRE